MLCQNVHVRMPTEFILVQLLMAWTYMLLQTTLVSILQQIIGGKDSCSWKPVWWTVLPPSPLWDFVIRELVALSNVCSFFWFSFFFLYFLMTFLEDRPYRLKEHSYIKLKISIPFHSMLRIAGGTPTKQQCSCGEDLLTLSDYHINQHWTVGSNHKRQATTDVKVQTLDAFL